MELQEIWEDIKDFEGYYQISNIGRVKALERKMKKGFCTFIKKEKYLKPVTHNGRYLKVTLYKDGKPTIIFVHRLVAQNFIDNPNNYKTINHKNNISDDNRVGNLEWCTQRENTVHSRLFYGTKHSKYPGITLDDRKAMKKISWRAIVRVDGKKKTYNGFKTEEDAYAKYLSVLKENGIVNKYATPLPEKRKLWKRPYYVSSSPNYPK